MLSTCALYQKFCWLGDISFQLDSVSESSTKQFFSLMNHTGVKFFAFQKRAGPQPCTYHGYGLLIFRSFYRSVNELHFTPIMLLLRTIDITALLKVEFQVIRKFGCCCITQTPNWHLPCRAAETFF